MSIINIEELDIDINIGGGNDDDDYKPSFKTASLELLYAKTSETVYQPAIGVLSIRVSDIEQE